MTKNDKSSATIRRRKTKYSQSDLDRVRSSRPSSHSTLEEIKEFNEEDEGYLFDDEILGPSIVKKIMSSEKTLLLALISLRMMNAMLIQTYFVPDEFWQSVEVAHSVAFGYGYLTWEWRNGIRGYLYPAVFSVIYKVLYILGLDSRLALIKLPRLVQGVMAAYGDLYLYKLSWSLCDRATAQWTLLSQTLSWFMLYCYTRTIANSTETVLVTIALYYYPWPGKQQTSNSTKKFLCLAALSVIVRPTAAVIWILLCSWHLQNNAHTIEKTLKMYIVIGCVSLFGSAMVDGMFYGRWTFVQYNFLQFNVLSGSSSFYGAHPWHWYITQGFPTVMGLHLPLFVLGAWKAKNKVLLLVILWTLFIYSFLPHKEFRFLMPIMPLAFHYCGVYFQSLCKKPRLKKKQMLHAYTKTDHVHGSQESIMSSAEDAESTGIEGSVQSFTSTDSGIVSEGEDKKDTKTVSGDQTCKQDDNEVICGKAAETTAVRQGLSTNEIMAEIEKKHKEKHRNNLFRAKTFVIILALTNIPVAMYFSLIHQRGTIVVTKHLYDASHTRDIDVLFLMPCHSTPYYSYIHRNISMRFLTCEPNLQHVENYTDEADLFYQDPVLWLNREYSDTAQPWPSHLVYFDSLQKQLSDFLTKNGYRECASLFHSHIPESRRGTHVIVSCR